MRLPTWGSAFRFEPSSALVLIIIGLGGFVVDVLLKPVSAVGLVLLLLAATPSLAAIVKRSQAHGGMVTATRGTTAKAPPAAGQPQRSAAPRPAAPDNARLAPPIASAPEARDIRHDRIAPAAPRPR